MTVRTSYDLKIPNDSAVTLAGTVLGETSADIEIRSASGPPLQDGGVLENTANRQCEPKILRADQWFASAQALQRTAEPRSIPL